MLTDGSYGDYLPVDDDAKPDVIRDHGTKVVLLGKSKDDDTMQPPERAAAPSRWIAKYLNTRYFRFPDGVVVKARQGWENPRSDTDTNVLRALTGQQPYLEKHKICSGASGLSGATAHWWILKDEKALGSNSGHIESSGHVAALYQEEIYETATGRAGMSRLQQFGVVFGYRQVVIYIQPTVRDPIGLTTNTARTQLLLNNEQLPWDEWTSEFRDNMPEEIAAFVKEKGNDVSIADHSKSVRDRLKEIIDLYKLSRYRPAPSGSLLIDDEQTVRGGLPSAATQASGTRSTSQASQKAAPGGTAGNIYSVFEKQGGKPGRRVNADPFPQVQWVSVKDGTRAPGFIEDRAATYLAPQNILQINGDFRAFDDMIDLWCRELDERPGVRAIVESAVHGWFEQALVETVSIGD